MIREAARWAAELDADAVTAERRDACEAWCAEHASHRLAFDRMRGFDSRFDGLDPIERIALTRAAGQSRGKGPRRRLAGGLLGLGAIILAGWFGATSFTGRAFFPDHRTAPGEQRNVAMADGSAVMLDTNSAIDIDEAGASRHVRLFRGRIMATVAADAARPFQVETRDGSVTALGTAFIVERESDRTLVTVVESHVRACPASRETMADCIRLAPGQRAAIGGERVIRLGAVDADQASAWTRGWLEADDRPLADVLTELNRYRARPIRFDARALAHIRVTGSYPLADAPRALSAIAGTAGIAVSQGPDGDVFVSAR
ncbi:FecR family protein [Sphingomonas colocasiae]|uniref:FecR domain-containing protein n=1 Tax=Sphingomonas colocasiae TaxID=1848973 RepID=A0ABS7PJX1_9SPHN|nr:FecR domain-containing protein [Sphingomonas colocasiae]